MWGVERRTGRSTLHPCFPFFFYVGLNEERGSHRRAARTPLLIFQTDTETRPHASAGASNCLSLAARGNQIILPCVGQTFAFSPQSERGGIWGFSRLSWKPFGRNIQRAGKRRLVLDPCFDEPPSALWLRGTFTHLVLLWEIWSRMEHKRCSPECVKHVWVAASAPKTCTISRPRFADQRCKRMFWIH